MNEAVKDLNYPTALAYLEAGYAIRRSSWDYMIYIANGWCRKATSSAETILENDDVSIQDRLSKDWTLEPVPVEGSDFEWVFTGSKLPDEADFPDSSSIYTSGGPRVDIFNPPASGGIE